MRKFLTYFILFFSSFVFAQELNCNVVVIAQQTGNENVQVFKTLEKQLKEFVNNTRWTKRPFELQERIDCSMIINIQNYDSDTFQASIQVQSARPIYNSTYTSTVYNFNDKDFNFKYEIKTSPKIYIERPGLNNQIAQTIRIRDGDSEPVIIVDGRAVTKDKIHELDPDKIKNENGEEIPVKDIYFFSAIRKEFGWE